MPSFDVVSEVDLQEVKNAVDQANRELANRFDFKGTDSVVELKESDNAIELESASEERLKAVTQVLEEKLVKRKVSLKAIDYGKVEEAAKGRARQKVSIQVGINDDKAREIGKFIKGLGLKGVQHQVQGDQLPRHGQEARRPTGRDPEAARARLRRAARLHELPRLANSRARASAVRRVLVPQARDAVRGRRVRTEQVREVRLLPGERIDDVRRRVRGVDVHRDLLRVGVDLLERTRASGSPVPRSSAPLRSASYSRERESDICRSAAAIGAKIIIAIAPRALPLRLRPLPPIPPKIAPHINIRARNVIPSATAAATDPMRMS